jgi:hypothetical protein
MNPYKEDWKNDYFNLYIKSSLQGKKLFEFPEVETANGLTDYICNLITLTGNYANRINSAGRVIKSKYGSVYIPTKTYKGTADIHACINGKHVSIEVKIGKDRQSLDQKKEEKRITNAKGIYMIVKDAESFYYALKFLLT